MPATSDAIVVGAGIVGAACAEALARDGWRVTILEESFAASGTTAAGMGHIVVMDDSPAQLALTAYSDRLWRALGLDHDPRSEVDRCGTLWIAEDGSQLAALDEKCSA
jgi:D-hydroxyproline dehydrogenase subunit beta